MTRRQIIFLCSLLALGAIAVAFRHRLRKLIPTPWENTGDYAGPLTRAAPAYNPSKPPSRPWVDPNRTAPPPTTYHTYTATAINGQQTDFLLYLPPGYHEPGNRERRYPVIYWLHGYSCEPQHGAPFVETLDAAIRAAQVPPTIAVLPNGLFDSWFVDSVDGSQPIESIVIKDLIPHVDQTWRTIPDRRGRAIEGFSMGGWGALHLAVKYPQLFAAVTSVSAPFHKARAFPQIHRIFSGDHAAYYAEDPVTRIRRNATQIRDALPIRIRILCGDKDDQGHLRYNLALDKRLTQWRIPHQTIILPGIRHNDADIYEKLGPQSFRFYQDVFNSAGKK